MGTALAKARLVVNQMEGTVWTSTGIRPDTQRAGAVWDNVEDHVGSVLAGCRGSCDDQSSQASTPIPVANASYIERFLQQRAEVIRELSRRIQEITEHAPAGLAAAQAASCLLRECIPQRSIHLLRVLDRTFRRSSANGSMRQCSRQRNESWIFPNCSAGRTKRCSPLRTAEDRDCENLNSADTQQDSEA